MYGDFGTPKLDTNLVKSIYCHRVILPLNFHNKSLFQIFPIVNLK